jgi:hypothetical protein
MLIAFQNGEDTLEITHNLSFLTGVEVKWKQYQAFKLTTIF